MTPYAEKIALYVGQLKVWIDHAGYFFAPWRRLTTDNLPANCNPPSFFVDDARDYSDSILISLEKLPDADLYIHATFLYGKVINLLTISRQSQYCAGPDCCWAP